MRRLHSPLWTRASILLSSRQFPTSYCVQHNYASRRRPAPNISRRYGGHGQSMLDELLKIGYTRSQPMSLLFIHEPSCFHMLGFPDMDQSECVEILCRIKSHHWNLGFRDCLASHSAPFKNSVKKIAMQLMILLVAMLLSIIW